MQLYTKADLIDALKAIRDRGWIENARQGNDGGIGNTLEDLLGIEENNLPIPNAAEWELKSVRKGTTALTTLFHVEPSPRAAKIVAQYLLPRYGWRHKDAGKKYPETELSFRQTIHAGAYSDRGFRVVVNRAERRVEIEFDPAQVGEKHKEWLDHVGTSTLEIVPYWGFQDLTHKAGTKLMNIFYVQADRRREGGREFFHYNSLTMLQQFNPDKFINAIEKSLIYIDFDARTGHNHGTKFRTRLNAFPKFYDIVETIF
ncbi:MAG: MvaI/BcnI restriction endonuclease family protein [Chloroflexi bacterium]|nr:MAG: MvaI/BcnI restriction endonuclease family protein [Chloroflexota bacterium]